MSKLLRQALIVLAALAAAASFLAFLVYLGSEAKISRRYTLPTSIAAASDEPGGPARGAHLAMIYGCQDCHTAPGAAPFTGRMLYEPPGLRLAAPNLTRFAAQEGAAGFDIALRHALSPEAKALWLMPSDAFTYLHEPDLAALIAYFLTLKPQGPVWPAKHFSFRARLAVVAGTLKPVDPYGLGQRGPRFVGPQYEGGQYLALMACASCHGLSLNGDVRTGVPDLRVTADYSRTAFFRLLREGVVPADRRAPVMAHLSARRFHVLKDYEVTALYDYLIARAGGRD